MAHQRDSGARPGFQVNTENLCSEGAGHKGRNTKAIGGTVAAGAIIGAIEGGGNVRRWEPGPGLQRVQLGRTHRLKSLYYYFVNNFFCRLHNNLQGISSTPRLSLLTYKLSLTAH